MKPLFLVICCSYLTACLSPEQQAERAAKRLRAEQALQVELARQCDGETADLIFQHFNPPLDRSPQAQAAFEQRYAEKVNNPLFQACYKLAWQNELAKEEIRRMQYDYGREYGLGFGFSRFCLACRW